MFSNMTTVRENDAHTVHLRELVRMDNERSVSSDKVVEISSLLY